MVCLACIFDVLAMGVFTTWNLALEDARLTGAGIKCLYCTCRSETIKRLKNKGDIRNKRPLLTDDCDIIAVLHVRGDGTL